METDIADFSMLSKENFTHLFVSYSYILMKTIPLHLLNALYVFSKSATLKEASTSLGLSQPGLSKQLKVLDSLLPQNAFATEGKRKVLTAYGRSITEEFEKRFRGFPETLIQITNQHTAPEFATVRVAGRREILDRFSEQISFPGRVIFTVLSNSETTEALLGGSIDFGVSWKQPDSPEVIAKPLFTERYQVVVPKSLSNQMPNPRMQEMAKSLLSIPCVTYKENDEVFGRFFRHYGLNTDNLLIKRTTANYQNLVRMIELGTGWSIVPIHYEVLKSRNWILPISDSVGLSKQFYLAYRRQISKLEWARSATSEIQDCFKR